MQSANLSLPAWPHAHGGPLFNGRIKQDPRDFEVVEELGWQLSGDGEHDFLWIEKTGQNTAWVASQLAHFAGVAGRDAGYSGLKDRHAVTKQWFSVRRPSGAGTNWAAFDVDGVTVLDVQRHHKKLKRGVHRHNRFRIVARDADISETQLEGTLAKISSSGIPNYFGPQRFGREGRNLALARSLFAGRRMKRQERSIAISAARSLLFNEVLAERIRGGTWDTGIPGDCFNLDGTNSVFGADDLDAEITGRISAMDIHPTGPLYGQGEPRCAGASLALESSVIARWPEWSDGLSAVGAKMARRALRVRVQNLTGATGDGNLTLEFTLATGAYATSVLRELATFDA